ARARIRTARRPADWPETYDRVAADPPRNAPLDLRGHADASMKIAHLVGWYFPDSLGGTEVYVEALSRRLRAAGHEVLIAAPDARGAAPEHYEHDGVPVFRYAIPAAPTRDEAYHRVPARGVEALYAWLRSEERRV